MGIIGFAEDEKGRELLAHELKEDAIVILQKEGRPMVTQWVVMVGENVVSFYAGEIRTLLVLKRNPDGTMEDDSAARIRAYEYLGEV